MSEHQNSTEKKPCCLGAEIPNYGHSRNCPVAYPNNPYLKKADPSEHQTYDRPKDKDENLTRAYDPGEMDLQK